MMFRYSVYGMPLISNRPIAGLNVQNIKYSLANPAAAELNICYMGAQAQPAPLPTKILWTDTSSHSEVSGPDFRIYTASTEIGFYHRLYYTDGVEHTNFFIAPHGTNVWISGSEGASVEEINALLLGSVLGRVLRLRGIACLHGNAVQVGEQAIVLVGNKGAGKSTTTAFLGSLGHPVITDDIAALTPYREGFAVESGHSYLRIHPGDATQLFGDDQKLLPIWDQLENRPYKSYLDIAQETPAPQQSVRLSAIYILEQRDARRTHPEIVAVEAAQGLLALLPHTYANDFINQTDRARDFSQIGRVVNSVAVRRVHRPDGLDALPSICKAIVEDAQSLAENEVKPGVAETGVAR